MSARDMQSTLCEPLGEQMVRDGQCRIAKFSGFDDEGWPLVYLPGAAAPQLAQTILDLGVQHIGESVLVLFDNNDVTQPIVLGLIRPKKPAYLTAQPKQPRSVSVCADGERVHIEAEKEIVFRCGKASITLTRSGKVLIRGAYVSSSSSGMVRVSGATVSLN